MASISIKNKARNIPTIVLFVVALLFVLPTISAWNSNTFSNYSCYQESANSSTIGDGSCGLDYSGNYSQVQAYPILNITAYDGNWNTYAPMTNDGNIDYIRAKYVIPSNNLGKPIFRIKYKNATTSYIEDLTITDNCWSYSQSIGQVSVGLTSYYDTGTISTRCEILLNSWEIMDTFIDMTHNSGIYEEAIIWNVANSTSENLTFTGNQNIIRYLSVPSNTILTNGYLNLTGNFSNFIFNGLCYQESANSLTIGDGSCRLDYSGSYYSQGSWIDKNNLYDGSWFSKGYNIGSDANLTINYTKPIGALNTSLWKISQKYNSGYQSTNLTILPSCWNYYPNKLSFKVESRGANGYSYWYCYDGNWNLINTDSTSYIYEEAMIWDISNGISNQNILIGNSKFSYSLNTTIQTSNLANAINSYLSTCTFSNGFCLVPFIFHSDTIGVLGYSNLIFNNNGLLENSITFNPTTLESSNEYFILNLTYDLNAYSSISASLVYNGTSYNSKTLTYGNYKLISNNITIPSVLNTGTVNTFYWSIALTNSSGVNYFNSTSHNQTVNKGTSLIVSDVCPAGTSAAFNFTSFWEQNLTSALITTANYYFTYGLSGNPNINSVNGTVSNVNSFSICLNDSQDYYNLGYVEIQYSVDGAVNRRYYVFSNTRATNQTVSIPLYALELASTTSFLFTAQTTTLIPYSNYYIGLLRWYPATNSYNLVEMAKTDDKGQALLHIQVDTASYRIGLYAPDGTLVKLLNSINFICQTTPCTYSVTVDPNPLDLTGYTNIQSSLVFNPTTKVFTFTWNDPSQASQTMNLTVFKGDQIVCSSSASGYTGVIFCDVSAFTGTLTANVYRTTASTTLIFSQLIEDIRQSISDVSGGPELGLFIGAILLILFAMIGSFNPVLVIILGIVSLIPLFILGSITTSILMAIGVLGGVIIHFLKRTNG